LDEKYRKYIRCLQVLGLISLCITATLSYWYGRLLTDTLVRACVIILAIGLGCCAIILTELIFAIIASSILIANFLVGELRAFELVLFSAFFIYFLELTHATKRFLALRKVLHNIIQHLLLVVRRYIYLSSIIIILLAALTYITINSHIFLAGLFPLRIAESLEYKSIYGMVFVALAVLAGVNLIRMIITTLTER
jgi:hypothetical protein